MKQKPGRSPVYAQTCITFCPGKVIPPFPFLTNPVPYTLIALYPYKSVITQSPIHFFSKDAYLPTLLPQDTPSAFFSEKSSFPKVKGIFQREIL